MSSQWTNATKNNPCPVCGHGDWCSITTDAQVVRCNRKLNKKRRDRNGTEYSLYYKTRSGGYR